MEIWPFPFILRYKAWKCASLGFKKKKCICFVDYICEFLLIPNSYMCFKICAWCLQKFFKNVPGVISSVTLTSIKNIYIIPEIMWENVWIRDNQRISYIYIENICVQILFLQLNNFPGNHLAVVAVCDVAYWFYNCMNSFEKSSGCYF